MFAFHWSQMILDQKYKKLNETFLYILNVNFFHRIQYLMVFGD